ncbi:DUF4179 domain-containing protein [Paenibacillus durus]|uniref:DUF4179 domain-containing protein n=1 Tax=Paenibacillus durus ATCC 35681 TaxID=1333534 RepID=A0A0F7FF27_PAEDU|nr:DUF4179 domain-containing protein [Paenibacillus durus]AKG37297.1 hypothetical protein VK70_24740 [Paenibacillus durus ATCC 35681]
MIQEIHSFKKEIDNIPVPYDKLDAIITKTVQATEAGKRTKMRKKMAYAVGAAAVACGLLFGSAALSPAMASIVSKIPVIGSVFSQYGDSGLKRVSENGLTSAVGITKVSGGDSLTINEVFYDGTRLSIGYSLETEKPMGKAYSMLRTGLTVNGKVKGFSGSEKQTELTPTYRTGILEIDPPTDLPDQFKLGLTFQAEDSKQWEFSIPISAQADTKLATIDHKQQAGGIDLAVPEITTGPAGIRLTYNAVSSETNDLVNYISFIAVDETGHELGNHSGGAQSWISGGKRYSTGTQLFDPPSAGTKTLTFTPHLSFPSMGGGVAIDQDGTETPIEFTPHQASEKIKFDSFTVTLP